MKKQIVIAILLVIAATFSTVAQNINWVSLDEALKLQKKEPKKIMMDVYTNWCGPCKMLDRNTFQNKDVVSYVNENYYAVKFNAEGDTKITFDDKTFGNPNFDPAKTNRRNSPHEFTRYLKVSAYPTIVFFDEDANFITPVRGYQNPQQLELYLKLFRSDKHKEMKTQEDFNAYYSAFKPQFKAQ